MALEFPATPTDGQIVGGYIYDSTLTAWKKYNPTQKADVFTSDVAPTPANDGDVWFNSSNGITSIYYEDEDNGQWVQLSEGGLRGPTGPTGSLILDVDGTAPTAPSSGELWYDSTDGKIYFYYTDSDSSQWVEIASTLGATGPTGPTGPVFPTGKSIAMAIVFG